MPSFLQGLGIANQAREGIDRQRVTDTEAADRLRNSRMLQRIIQMAYMHEMFKEQQKAEQEAAAKSAVPSRKKKAKAAVPAEEIMPLGLGVTPGRQTTGVPGMGDAMGTGITPDARYGLSSDKFNGIYDDTKGASGWPTFLRETMQSFADGGMALNEKGAESMARQLMWHARRFANGGMVDTNGVPMGVPFADGGEITEPELTEEELMALDAEAFLKKRLEDGEILGANDSRPEPLPVTGADLGPQFVPDRTALYGRLLNARLDVPALADLSGWGPGAGTQAIQDADAAFQLDKSLEDAAAIPGMGETGGTTVPGEGDTTTTEGGGATTTEPPPVTDPVAELRHGGMVDRWGQKGMYVPSPAQAAPAPQYGTQMVDRWGQTPQYRPQVPEPKYKSILQYLLELLPEKEANKTLPTDERFVRGANGGRVGLYGFMKNTMTPQKPKRGKAVKMKGGGMVRGPGTGTSDSVPASIGGRTPARLSNGEYVLSADTVRAVGKDKLDALQAKYHKPVR